MPTNETPNEADIEYDVVAIAASAGGLAAISTLLRDLPADFPPSILIVQHLDRHHKSLMSTILERRTALKVLEASHGVKIEPSTVYIAPPNHHMLLNPDRTICLTQTELVHFVRPSADLLFESVAASLKERAIAVVLTGSGCDGSLGVKAIGRMGGVVIAQDEASSHFFSMPDAAIKTGYVNQVIPLEQIASTIEQLVRGKQTNE